MLNRLISILPLGNQKYPLVYQRMIDAINVRLDIQKNKFLLGHPTQTLGVELLRFIMLNIDLEEILSYESDIDKTDAADGDSGLPGEHSGPGLALLHPGHGPQWKGSQKEAGLRLSGRNSPREEA